MTYNGIFYHAFGDVALAGVNPFVFIFALIINAIWWIIPMLLLIWGFRQISKL